ncbi:MAG: Ig-like domain-containing protein [Candidatus Eremiobacteraeota bacterium]|nr:Ig-like domain-containing protein [Candidatus Eremiobacteraeota bacterium]
MANPFLVLFLFYTLTLNALMLAHRDIAVTQGIGGIESRRTPKKQEPLVSRSRHYPPGVHDICFPFELTACTKGFYGRLNAYYQGTWRFVPTPPPFLHAGKGYRLFNDTPLTITIEGVTAEGPVTVVPLSGGWNFVGNPYEERMPWNAAKVFVQKKIMPVDEAVGRHLINATLKEYENGELKKVLSSSESMEPWKGYWTFTTEPCYLLFVNPGEAMEPAGGTLEVTASPSAIPADDTTFSVIEATLKDSQGEPLAGREIHLETVIGRIVPRTIMTDKNGKARATFLTGTLGNTIIAASCGSMIKVCPLSITVPEKNIPPPEKPAESLVNAAVPLMKEGRFGINGFHEINMAQFPGESAREYINWEARSIFDGGISFNRTISPQGGLLAWKFIEGKPGVYDFSYSDAFVREVQKYRIRLLAVLSTSNSRLSRPRTFIGEDYSKPHDFEAFARYVEKVVERYDGDGYEDMPGLKYPIKHWEIGNEPEMPFEHDSGAFLRTMKTAYEAMKRADRDAKALVFVSNFEEEMTPRERVMRRFWDDILAQGGYEYIDILSIHHPLMANAERFQGLSPFWQKMQKTAGKKKEVWMTEWGIVTGIAINDDILNPGYHMVFAGGSEEDTASSFVKFVAKGFATGIDRFFWTFFYATKSEFMAKASLCKPKGFPNLTYYTQKLIALKIGGFTSARELRPGVYEFMVNGKPVYVAWNAQDSALPVRGMAKVTDIHGNEEELLMEEVILKKSPLIFEPAGK